MSTFKISVMSAPPPKHISDTQASLPNPFYRGITTRVMAQKQITQLKRDSIDKSSPRSSINGQSKFLSGTSIPNSTIRSSIDTHSIKFPTNENRDPSPQLSSASHQFLLEESDEDLKKKQLSEKRGMERMRKKIHSSTFAKKEAKMRRSTLESIKDAIEKSQTQVTKLVNADSMEKRNVGQHFKVLNTHPTPEIKKEKVEPTQEKIVQKRDLQTQTSLLLENLYVDTRPN